VSVAASSVVEKRCVGGLSTAAATRAAAAVNSYALSAVIRQHYTPDRPSLTAFDASEHVRHLQ